jgi:biopolymer transport protein ExbD
MRIGHLGKALFLATLAVTITGCDQTVKYELPRSEATKQETPIYVTCNAEGVPVVLDSEGNPLKVEGTALAEETPNPSTTKDVTQITARKASSSRYYLLYINGRYYKIQLPN